MIGKIGPYTVFMTPPATPKPSTAPEAAYAPPQKIASPPVQPPPAQFQKISPSDSSNLAFFWNAVAKVQNAHSSLDEHVARWFGLNQSKYQWALDDYYDSKGEMGKEDEKAKNISTKVQSV